MSAILENAAFPFVMVALIAGFSYYRFRKNGGNPAGGDTHGHDNSWTDSGDSGGGDGGD
jgi:hypothetical protein